MAQVSMTVNGKVRKGNVEPRVLLVHFLREQLRLTGTHIGCDTSQCGACTVLIDGRSAKSCTIFAVQADGSTITTIEGLAPDGQLHPLQAGFLGGARPAVRLLHARDDHGGGHAAEGQPDAVGARNPRRHLRQSLPLHRLSAHRQRHSERRKEEVSHGHHISSVAEARGPARQAARGSASHSGPRHLRRRHRARRHAAPRVQAQRRGARTYPSPSIRVPRRRWTASKRCSPARRSPRCLAPMPIGTPFPSPDHRAVAVDTVRYGGEPVAVVVASDRYVARDAADAIVVSYDTLPAVVDLELAMTGQADGHSSRLSEQPRGGAGAERHRRERLGRGRRLRDRRGVREGRGRHLAADGEPAPRAVGDGAERRGGALRAGQGHDDDLVVDAEPAHPADVHRRADRAGPGSGPSDRSGSGRRFRRQDQHLRRRVRRGRDLEASRHSGEVDRRPLGSLRGDDARPRHPRLRRSRGEARRHACSA